jgi:TRAP-type uncharacterized transport system substrate-binding protein
VLKARKNCLDVLAGAQAVDAMVWARWVVWVAGMVLKSPIRVMMHGKQDVHADLRSEIMCSTRLLSLVFVALVSLLPVDIFAGSPPGDARERSIVISAGLEGRGYWGVATRLREVAEEQGFKVEVMESVGSMQNLQRLGDPDAPVGLALTQADALQHFLPSSPGLASQIEILEYIGQECVFIIARANSGIRTIEDLEQGAGHRLAIISPESGVAITFQYMSTLEPKLRNTRPVYMDTEKATRELMMDDSPVDAVMLVHRPKVLTPEIQLALEHPDDYQLVTIKNKKLNERLPNGDAVYKTLDVVLLRSGAEAKVSVETICTKAFLVANKQKLSTDQWAHLQRLIDYHWMRVYATE